MGLVFDVECAAAASGDAGGGEALISLLINNDTMCIGTRLDSFALIRLCFHSKILSLPAHTSA